MSFNALPGSRGKVGKRYVTSPKKSGRWGNDRDGSLWRCRLVNQRKGEMLGRSPTSAGQYVSA